MHNSTDARRMLKMKGNRLTLIVLSLLVLWPKLGVSQLPQEPTQTHIVHMLNRVGYGPKPDDITQVQDRGLRVYLYQQLHPETLAVPKKLQGHLDSIKCLKDSCAELLDKYYHSSSKEKREMLARNISMEFACARVFRALESPCQLEEAMVDFWYRHFSVSSQEGVARLLAGPFERDAIRPHVFGKFENLLLAVAKHPAMLFYRDNWKNRKPHTFTDKDGKVHGEGINERFSRELIGRYTLGPHASYTNDDVTALAHLLTGWTFFQRTGSKFPIGVFVFDERRHDTASTIFLGQEYSGDYSGGERALRTLAQHPTTARHICHKLAHHFIEDNPQPEIVDLLTNRFQETGGDIRAVLETLFTSDYFWQPSIIAYKYKNSYHYVLSAVRALGRDVVKVQPIVNRIRQLRMPLYTPQEYDQEDSPTSASLVQRILFAVQLSRGHLRIHEIPESTEKLKNAFDLTQLASSLGVMLAPGNLQIVTTAPEKMQQELFLGSPEFMRR